jgi:hypothetical protein
MQHEQRDYNNLADLWRSAQRRRTEDIYSLVVHFFKRQRARFFGKIAWGRPRMRGTHESPSRLKARPDVPFDTSNRIDSLITRCSCHAPGRNLDEFGHPFQRYLGNRTDRAPQPAPALEYLRDCLESAAAR